MKITVQKIIVAAILLAVTTSCSNNKSNYDASGSFEAEEYIISSESNGIIKELNIEEGEVLKANQQIGYVDSTQLYLKKRQLEAQIMAVLGKRPNVSLQLSALNDQLKTAQTERERVYNLVQGDAAPSKQLDDIDAQIEVIKSQINAQKSTLTNSNHSINNEVVAMQMQLEQVINQLEKSTITNPVDGTVLTKFAKANEMTGMGKPLYKIADIENMILRAYITGNQLPQVKLNQTVTVKTDDGNGGFHETPGTVTWISDKAEFTPKTIQTKNERANLVYAIKVNVKNDGKYKIGMYGEINF